jgi:hypothetical protein
VWVHSRSQIVFSFSFVFVYFYFLDGKSHILESEGSFWLTGKGIKGVQRFSESEIKVCNYSRRANCAENE